MRSRWLTGGRCGNRRGMTLVELMVALAIFAVVTTVLISFLTGSRRTYNDTSGRASYQQSLRAVFSLLTREIRSTGCDPTEGGIVDRFVVADASQLRCQMDLDGNGDVLGTAPDEDITYSYDSATESLTRTTLTGSIVILHDVQGLAFSYYDDAGNPLVSLPLSPADRQRVHFVGIAIAGETDQGEPVTYSTRVLVRNG